MNQAIIEALCIILNKFDGWNLTYDPMYDYGYDVRGYTPKNLPCVMKFHYGTEEPHITLDNYNRLNKVGKDINILYIYVNQSINYLFWIPEVKMTEDGDRIWLDKKDAKLINFGERIL